MIYFAPSLVISAGADNLNGNNGCIGYHNLVELLTVTTTSEDAGYPATNLANPATYLKWKATSTAVNYITVDTSAYGDVIDYIAIAKHNLGSAGIAVSVEADDGGGYAEIIAPVIPSPDNEPLIFRFDPTIYNGVRLKLATGSVAAEVAVVYCGKLLVLQRRIYVGYTPITMARMTDVYTGMSENGQFMGRIILGSKIINGVSLKNFTALWYRVNFEPFAKFARTLPWFFAWRPEDYPLEVGYCWATKDITPVNDLANGMMRTEIAMNGIVSS